MRTTDGADILRVSTLDVFYGKAHALQQVSLSLPRGVLAVVGRNGMGKTTLCRAITGMVPAQGSILFGGREVLGLPPHRITHAGIGYVPQGRRVWRSLTVDETLRLSAGTARQGSWTVERVYQAFPRLAERRGNGGAQLSGGEQQMLAIGRALLFNPSLLVMDEPTEGLAPVIVEQVATLLRSLADEGSVSVLLIEQNLGVALEVADRVAIMVNGRIAHELPAAELAADKALQQRMLGLRAGASDGADSAEPSPSEPSSVPQRETPVLRVVRSFQSTRSEDVVRELPAPVPAIYVAGAFAPGDSAPAEAVRIIEAAGTRVVTLEITSAAASSAQVTNAEIMGYGRTPAEALRAYLLARSDLGGLLVVAPGATAELGLTAVQVPAAEGPRILVTDRQIAGAPADLVVMTLSPSAWHSHASAMVSGAAQAILGTRQVKNNQRMRRTSS